MRASGAESRFTQNCPAAAVFDAGGLSEAMRLNQSGKFQSGRKIFETDF
jgi:hypothetical protein